MRKYQPIWEALKKDPTKPVSLIAPADLHPRIIQAVKKEKAKDAGWRLLNSENKIKYILSHTRESNKITFKLTEKPLTLLVTL